MCYGRVSMIRPDEQSAFELHVLEHSLRLDADFGVA